MTSVRLRFSQLRPQGRPQLRPPLRPTVQPDLAFWLCFLSLNGLLFAPLYLLNLESSSFWPVAIGEGASAVERWQVHLLTRDNYDIFRLNVELTLLVLLWLNVGWLRRPAYRWAFAAFYLLAFYYAVYEAGSLSLYQEIPNFFNQYRFVVDGAGFLLAHLNLTPPVVGVAALGFLLANGLLVWIALTLLGGIPPERLSGWTVLTQGALGAVALFALISFGGGLASPAMEFSSVGAKLQQNVSASLQNYRKAAQLDDIDLQQAHSYAEYTLGTRPNIYLIFVESYGSVLYKRTDYEEAYTALLRELEPELRDAGWSAASALSEAPTWGGGSWMSYTSALFGLRVDAHPQYLALLNKYQNEPYPDLGRWLRGQGYQQFRVSSLSDEMPDLEWQRYQSFYGVDGWLRYRDLEYTGSRYGWGPAPPDQYVLSFTQEHICQTTDDPFLLFFITQNSHYPWNSLPAIVDDWRTLNQPVPVALAPDEDEIEHGLRRRNYFDSVEYELRFLTQFIRESGDEDALYVLIGDHQPPRVSKRADGWDTPIHIISRNRALVDSLGEYGFEPGLRVGAPEPAMKHEGLYSLLVRVLLSHYGENEGELPAYLPDGFATGT